MGLSFQVVLPQEDSGRLMMDLPLDICSKLEDKPMQKVKVIINGLSYLCNLYKKQDNRFSLHIIRAIKRDIGLGCSVSVSLESVEDTQKDTVDIHQAVQNWENNECVKLMRNTGVKEGDKIIDFGCGYGHYTVPCAMALNGTGMVYAIDGDNNALEWIKTKMDMYKIDNINTIKTDRSLKIDFEDRSIDAVLMYDIVHIVKCSDGCKSDIPIRLPIYQEAHRVLKEGGRLSVLTFDSEIKKITSKDCIRGKFTYNDLITEIIDFGFDYSHSVEGGIHFDWYHSNYQINKGLSFDKLERGTIYNFTKKT